MSRPRPWSARRPSDADGAGPRPLVRPAVLAALVLGTAGVAVASPGGADARTPVGCGLRAAETVAHAASTRVVAVRTNEDDLYGGDVRLLACRGAHGRPHRLVAFASPDDPAFSRFRFAGPAVAFATVIGDGSCGKYDPGATCPVAHTVGSYDARTGRRLVAVGVEPAQLADGLAVGRRGALAWVTPADAAGVRTVLGSSGGPPRALGTGDVDPASVGVTGGTATWRTGRGADAVTSRAPIG